MVAFAEEETLALTEEVVGHASVELTALVGSVCVV